MDNQETLQLLQSLEDESDLDSIDDEIAVDTDEQQLECSDTEQDISTDEDESGDVSSEQNTGKDSNTNWKQSKSISCTRTRAHNIVSENQVLWALCYVLKVVMMICR